LKDVDAILERIKDYKPNTQRSYIISIVSLLKQEPKMKKLYDRYYTILMNFNKELKTNNEKSETQKDNWISQEEVKEIYDKITAEVKELIADKKKLTPSEYEKVLRWFILSLYTLQKPRRNADYQLALVSKTKLSGDIDPQFNHLDLNAGKWFFNNYKTKGTYKTQELEINDEMKDAVETYLKFHPHAKMLKKKGGVVPLLADFEGEPLQQVNSITRILNKIFGKKIGVSMLRNIYLTDKFGDKVKELNETANEMGTSSSTIQNQYVKIEPDASND
jgi:integrase